MAQGIARRIGILGAIVAVTACASAGPSVESVAYVDHGRAAGIETFNIIPGGLCEGSRLLEQQFLQVVTDALGVRGFRQTDDNPDAVVVGMCDARREDLERPGTTLYLPITNVVTGEPMGVMSTETPGTTVTRYSRTIVVQMFTANDVREWLVAREAGESPTLPVPVWDGRATTSSRNADLLEVAPSMVEAMLAEAPLGSPGPSRR